MLPSYFCFRLAHSAECCIYFDHSFQEVPISSITNYCVPQIYITKQDFQDKTKVSDSYRDLGSYFYKKSIKINHM